jgi:hypothetical protein
MKIDKKAIVGEWVEFPDKEVSFHLRPFPFSKGVWSFNEDTAFVDSTWAQFNYCVMGWKGIMTKDDEKELPCNDENKLFLFDFVPIFRNFCLEEAKKLSDKLTVDLGN